jgi:hypothetical protein
MGSRRAFVKMVFVALGSVPLFGHVGRAFANPRKKHPPWQGIERSSVITCPVCSHSVSEKVSRETLKRVFHCPQCLTWLAPKPGDHCIYDSYGSFKCPPLQLKAKGRGNWKV